MVGQTRWYHDQDHTSWYHDHYIITRKPGRNYPMYKCNLMNSEIIKSRQKEFFYNILKIHEELQGRHRVPKLEYWTLNCLYSKIKNTSLQGHLLTDSKEDLGKMWSTCIKSVFQITNLLNNNKTNTNKRSHDFVNSKIRSLSKYDTPPWTTNSQI